MLRLRIGEILEERKINVAEFARGANISRATALSLKRGVTTRMDIPTLDKVCEYLKLTPSDLFDDSKKNKGK